MNWVNIKDVLPPLGERVLACTNDGWVFIAKDFCVGDEINDSDNGVAYWMPLPNAPTERNNKNER